MSDLIDVLLKSSESSQKVIKEGSGTVTVGSLPGAGEGAGTAIIPHGYSSDNLLFQVFGYGDAAGGVIDPTVLPWASSDNRVIVYASVDSTNLYIVLEHNDSGGGGDPARNFHYTYRILIP